LTGNPNRGATVEVDRCIPPILH